MKKYFLSIIVITILFACKKDIMQNNRNATLHFSNDTIIFDTAFHSIGTPTKTLTVYNFNNFNVFTDISLKLINRGNFRMNVDGVAGNTHNRIEIPARDSIFIFLEVTANEGVNNQFLLTSNIEFTTGTKKQDVKLVSPGRNANFHLPQDNMFMNNEGEAVIVRYFSIKEDQTWTDNLPHVIYGQVIIEPEATLTIEEGTQIYFHNNSGIFVGNPLIDTDTYSTLNNGKLIINGKLGNEVTMQGDRLESWYENMPGQWNGIHFVKKSESSIINYAIIRNGTTAIRVDSADNSQIIINNTIIENMSSIGILGQTANISATNTVVSKCGQYTVACYIGGIYNFTHCTFANYWDYNNRNTPSILLNNYYEGVDGKPYPRDLEEANFTNCIIDGSLSTEVSFQKYEEEDISFNYRFNHCLIKLDPTIGTNNSYYSNVIINQSPKFLDNRESDFHLMENSPAIDAGIGPSDSDIEGSSRSTPDIGAYEYK